MLVDSHCHLNMLDTKMASIDDYLQRAKDHDITHMLCVATTLETFPDILALASNYANVSCSVGLHPNERECHEPSVEELITLAKQREVVAIGETGLDYFRCNDELPLQQRRFRKHIAAARAVNKPLIIHTRQAQADTIAIMHEESARESGGVLHCFTETWEMAKKALDMGFYISLSGIVTFKNTLALKEVAKKIPLDRLLIETDSPFLAPVPHRGKQNEPAFVYYVATYLAQLLNTSLELIALTTTKNFYNLFPHAMAS